MSVSPRRARGSLRLLWFPALYVVGFAVAAVAIGLPPAATTLTILANTAMVGVSEELACRGVLYRGLRVRFSLWTAILVSTALFGAVHVLNGLATGDFAIAALQAVTAFMTGIAFMALRLRTGSLYPVMILHTLWDFTLITTLVALVSHVDMSEPESPMTAALAAVPLLFILPNFLYGLFLLRHATRDEAMVEGARGLVRQPARQFDELFGDRLQHLRRQFVDEFAGFVEGVLRHRHLDARRDDDAAERRWRAPCGVR